MMVQEKSGLDRGIENLARHLKGFSVEDYIADNTNEQNVAQLKNVANLFAECGLVEIAEKVQVGIARYNNLKSE